MIISETKKFDPWEAKQEIEELKLKVHCSRYWMLSEWECENMSFPFWRLYHSQTGGSFVSYKGTEFELTAEKLVLIPPSTSFSSHIKKAGIVHDESILGHRLKTLEEVEILKNYGLCDQLFIHFNIGLPYDKIKPGIYEIPLNESWQAIILQIKSDRLEKSNNIDIKSSILLNSLILYALQAISNVFLDFPVIDQRIIKVIAFIDKNIAENLTNSQLSSVSNLATNSFARLFKSSMGCTVQEFIQVRRIEKAIMILHHSNNEIEEIALECGFYDRHHFSKVFKKMTGLPPAKYRVKIELKK